MPQGSFVPSVFFTVRSFLFYSTTISAALGIFLTICFSSAFAVDVTSTADSGAGSLRQILPTAVTNEEVTFSVDTVNISSVPTIGVNNNNVRINGLTGSGARALVTWSGATPRNLAVITQANGVNGLSLENIAFSNFARSSIELNGGGLVSAQTTTTGAALLGTLSNVSFTGTNMVISGDINGAGLVGAGSFFGNVAVGDIQGEFSNNQVSFSIMNGAGLVGAGVRTSGSTTPNSYASVGSVNGVFSNNRVTSTGINGRLIQGGGLVGASVWADGGNATVGTINGAYTGNVITVNENPTRPGMIQGGGLIGAQSEFGSSLVGDISSSATFSGNSINTDVMQGGGLIGTFSWNYAGLENVAGTYSNNIVHTAQGIYGGGLAGFFSFSDGAIGPVNTIMNGNTIITDADELMGGGLIGAFTSSGTGSFSDITGTFGETGNGNTIQVTGNLYGGGIIGSANIGGSQNTTTGTVNAAISGNTVTATSSLYGGGLTGVFSEEGNALLGAQSGTTSGNTVTVGTDVFGGGLAGVFAAGQGILDSISGIYSNNRVNAAANVYGGGMLGAYTDLGGQSTVGAVNANIAGNVIAAGSTIVGGGVIGSYSSNEASLGLYSGTISGNTVTAGENVLGGGLAGAWTTAAGSTSFGGLSNAFVTGNNITVGSASSTGTVVTGGLFGASGLNAPMTLADSTITGNTVSVTGPGYATDGGLIYIGTDHQTTNAAGHEVILSASGGRLMQISGNSFLVNGADQTKSLVFGTQGGPSQANALLSVNPAANGTVILDHPLYVAMDNGQQFLMNVNGPGTLLWNGRNELNAAGGAQVGFMQGSNSHLGENYILTASSAGNLNVTIENGSSITLDARRNPNTAVFDFTNAANAGTAGSFSVGQTPGSGDGALISLDISRVLNSFEGFYLVADGIHNDDRDNVAFIAGDNVVGFDATRNGQFWIYAAYNSPLEDIISCWKNLASASSSLEALLADRATVSDAQAAAIMRNLNSATPDHIMNQAQAGLNTAQYVASSALSKALPHASAPWDDLDEEGSLSQYTIRPWASSINQFARQSTQDCCYRGYKQDINGALAGINVDFERLSAGMYAGYTKSSTNTNGADSRVGSDGYHAGLVAKALPFSAWDFFAVSLDAGYSHIENDAWRNAGAGGIEGDFDQNIYTAGIALEHAIPLGDFSVTPIVKARYTYLDQDALEEKFGLTSTRVDGLDGESFTTEAGVAISHTTVLSSSFEIQPYANTAWRHEYGDRDFASSAQYVWANRQDLSSYPIRSVESDKDSLVLGAGLQVAQPLAGNQRIELGLGYDANFGKNSEAHAISGTLTYSF